MNLNRRRCNPLPFRPGFTLVEVMVALILISILGAMTMTAVRGVTQNARLARTRSIIAVIDSVIEEQYEGYKYRPLSVEVPDLSRNLPSGVFGYELLPSEAARVRLNMLRDLQRMELPDRIGDLAQVDPVSGVVVMAGAMPAPVVNQPAQLTAIANPVMQVGSQMRRDPTRRQQFPVNWFGGTVKNVPSRFGGYLRRITPTWNVANQGAECLYLIVASSFVGGSSAIESIPSSNIGDTDKDGMLEILDGWERPIEFVRWPCGYHLADTQLSIDLNLPDDFDMFRSDFGFLPNLSVTKPWSMRPLVVSSGSDGEFGLHLVPRTQSLGEVRFRVSPSTPASGFQDMSWPLTAAMMGGEEIGRTGTYFFHDPYLRLASSMQVAFVPGQPVDGAQSVRDDNISNYALAAE
jgi:prepilin-type N-terminal cleavage/methylation domain-containing protein